MPVKVGVIGAGAMGMNHLRVLRDLDDETVQLVGVADPSETALNRATNRFHVRGYRAYPELIDEQHPDLVAVVVPTHLHHEVAAHALTHNIHVLLEKPIASTIEEAEHLIALAEQHGVWLAVGHVERFNPAVMALKQQLVAGNLGKIFSLHARRLGPFPPRIRDVGVILDLATHDLDVMRYLLDAEVIRVYAETQRHIHEKHEDLLLGLIRFSNNAVGALDVNWLTPNKVRELTVTGERGMYLVNYLSQDLFFHENDYTATNWDVLRSMAGVSEGTMTRLKVAKAEPLRREYEDVIAAVREHHEPTVTGADGLAILHIAQQLMAATREGHVITSKTQRHS